MLARPAHCRYLLAAVDVLLADGANGDCNRLASGRKSGASLRKKGSDLANQWGRDNDFRPGARRGGAGTVIAVLIALLFGGAGGYGASLFLQDDQSVVSDAVQVEKAELDKALAVARDELSDARAAEAASAAEAEALKADVARMADELDALARELAESNTPTAVPEETIRAMDTLERERDGLAAENEAFRSGLEALEAERQAFERQANADRQRFQAELEQLQGEILPALTSERDQLKRQTETLQADQAALEARIEAASEDQGAEAARIAELEDRLASTRRELEAARLAIETLRREAQAAANNDQVDGADVSPGQPQVETDASGAAPALDARDRGAVTQALRTAPGLETLSEAERQGLTDRLVNGECVTSALESLFDRVPILTLRNLIRDLNSSC